MVLYHMPFKLTLLSAVLSLEPSVCLFLRHVILTSFLHAVFCPVSCGSSLLYEFLVVVLLSSLTPLNHKVFSGFCLLLLFPHHILESLYGANVLIFLSWGSCGVQKTRALFVLSYAFLISCSWAAQVLLVFLFLFSFFSRQIFSV